MMKSLFTACLLIMALPVWADNLTISDAWVREAPPTAKVLAAYMTLSNPGEIDMNIVNANSPQFQSVEFHNTVIKDGIASMEHMEVMTIPAGNTVALSPGGMHVMLMGANKVLVEGDSVDLELEFEDGSIQTMTVPVKKADVE